jgi:serine/threonine-protein kinase
MPTAAFGSLIPETSERAELAPGRCVGEWRIERHVADGGMAEVYAAVHPILGRRAAIKVLNPELAGDADAVSRFREEARIVSRIAHRNLVDVFSFGTLPDQRPYFVMEWLAGQTLQARLRAGPLPLDRAFDIVDQIACALEAAHAHGVVHRDVKPENVVLVPLGDRDLVKLVDFGVAKSKSGTRRTLGSVVLGTPEYFSPEQASGAAVDPRSDIYSLGIVLYEMIVGARPFDGNNPMALAQLHLSAPVPRLSALWPGVPPAIDDLVWRMLAKDPRRRPALAEVRSQMAGAPPLVRRPRHRRRWLAVMLAAGALSVGAVMIPVRQSVAPLEAAPLPAGVCEPGDSMPRQPRAPKAKKRRLSDELLDPFGSDAR